MEHNINHLFVYGSLRKGFQHTAYQYISKHFTFVAEAKVRGILFDLGEYPAGIPTLEDYFIKGELYVLKESADFSWAIEQLDDYEGLYPVEGEQQLYTREVAKVFHHDSCTQAWIYWYKNEITTDHIIPSGDTFDYLSYKSNQ